jgi:hypothetical protein
VDGQCGLIPPHKNVSIGTGKAFKREKTFN